MQEIERWRNINSIRGVRLRIFINIEAMLISKEIIIYVKLIRFLTDFFQHFELFK